MKINKIKNLHLQAFANESWRDVIAFDNTAKKEAVSLLKFKKKTEKQCRWRLILRTISEKTLM